MNKCEIRIKLNTKLNLKFVSKCTVNAYINSYNKFSSKFSKLDRLNLRSIEDYLIEFKTQYSISYYNQMVSMLKFLYKNVLNQPRKVSKLKLLKQPDTLHEVLSPAYVIDAISKTSVRNICKRAGICSPHLLRHSIITHLIDSGNQQTKVQMFAGHKSPQSTLKYYHTCTSQIKSLSLPKINI